MKQLNTNIFLHQEVVCVPSTEFVSVCLIKFYQEDVGAEFEDAVDAGQLLEHDGVADPAEELSDKLPDHQHHRGVQSHDASGDGEEVVFSSGNFHSTSTIIDTGTALYNSSSSPVVNVDVYPYPARNPRLGGLTLSLNTNS